MREREEEKPKYRKFLCYLVYYLMTNLLDFFLLVDFIGGKDVLGSGKGRIVGVVDFTKVWDDDDEVCNCGDGGLAGLVDTGVGGAGSCFE
jgi:hypothetical protein